MCRTGEYDVSVVVSNPLGNVTTSLKLFILEKVCKPPQIELLGDSGRKVRSAAVWLH